VRKPLTAPPQYEDDDRLEWSGPWGRVEVRRANQGFELWVDGVFRCFTEGVAPPAAQFRMGESSAVAMLRAPVWIHPGAVCSYWLEWPLEHVWFQKGTKPLHVARLHRKALVGSPAEGRVLPAAWVERLTGPRSARQGFAALHVRVQHMGSEPVRVRRVPLFRTALQLSRWEGSIAAVGVRVLVRDGSTASSQTLGGSPPSGFKAIGRMDVTIAKGLGSQSLAWVLEAGRRATEFDL